MGCGAGGYQGGYTGWCTGWVYRGSTTQPSSTLLEEPNQRSGPRNPCRGGVGGLGGRTGDGGGYGPETTLRARSVPAAPPCLRTSECRLTANRARFQQYSSKVSQNDEVSTEYVNKACHSPYSQNDAQMSPLEILRFPYSVAFSGKELMGHF